MTPGVERTDLPRTAVPAARSGPAASEGRPEPLPECSEASPPSRVDADVPEGSARRERRPSPGRGSAGQLREELPARLPERPLRRRRGRGALLGDLQEPPREDGVELH